MRAFQASKLTCRLALINFRKLEAQLSGSPNQATRQLQNGQSEQSTNHTNERFEHVNKLCRVLSFNVRSENRLENMTKIAIGPVGGNADSTKTIV